VFRNAPENYRTVADANAWLTAEESKIIQGDPGTLSRFCLDGSRTGSKWLPSNPIKRERSTFMSLGAGTGQRWQSARVDPLADLDLGATH
jgi:hypothetical protein